MGACDPGLSETRELTVEDCHTASSTGSGDVDVLSTPTLLGLAEEACVAAIRDDMPTGQTSVGAWSEIEHLSPVPVGTEVCACATLRGHHGTRLEFVVIVRDGEDIVAKVRHRRVLVDRQRFTAKVEKLAEAHQVA
jgi:fluoroacetyl-CoA thioesterase